MMNLLVSGFDWDDGNRAKCQKHGVSIVEIEALFVRGPRIAPDPKHSVDENRLIAVTARYMHGKEIAAYEKAAYENDSPAPEKR